MEDGGERKAKADMRLLTTGPRTGGSLERGAEGQD